MKKIVLAPDSFKGSLSAERVAECCEAAIRSVMPDVATVALPVADGGEGTVEALATSFGGREVECEVAGPLGKKVVATYLLSDDAERAVMEAASACGLTLVAKDERNPLLTTTRGLGEMIADAMNRGCREFFIGLGGSATNDLGMGMLSALGYRFLDEGGLLLPGCGGDLQRVATIDFSGADARLKECRFTVACDVDNPLYGKRGAAYIYAPQKGADQEMVEHLDAGLLHLSGIIAAATGRDISGMPGAGAAGGLGGAFAAFLNSVLKPGIEMVLDAVGLEDHLRDADLVVTGEGRMDAQSLMGKVISGVLKRSKRHGVPVVAICGGVEECESLNISGICGVFPVVPGIVAPEEAMDCENTADNIIRTMRQILRLIKQFKGN